MQNDPIALVGMECRFPGAADVESYWQLLMEGVDAVTEVPKDRFDIDEWYDPEPAKAGKIISRAGGLVDGVKEFDARFFGLSRREAVRIDPRHRLILETAWEALEDAGLDTDRLRGSNTAVYVACLNAEYWDLLREAGLIDLHAALCVHEMAAARLSHELDLRGPSMAVQASCASALLGVHLACQSLRAGDSDVAVVASANLLLRPEMHAIFSQAQLLSPSGRCWFGDVRADGFVRSEGVAAVVLKPLERALADGDRVHAVVLGSAAVHDGSTSETLIAPGIESQVRMLQVAYEAAGVSPSDIDYVEAHGPGTVKGDHAELTALATVLGEGRQAERPCLVGSVKTNIGHTEATAGLASFIKTALALRNRTVPATLYAREINPALRGDDIGVRLALNTEPWPETGRPGLAGVSAFGLSGTNVHVVMAEPPPAAPARAASPSAFLLPLSARSAQALDKLARRYRERLLDVDDLGEIDDICYSAGARRTHHDHRAAVVGTDARSLLEGLDVAAAGDTSDEVIRRDRPIAKSPRIVFVFPGQGSQWLGMGRELMTTSGVFAATVAQCDEAIREELGWSVIDRLDDDDPMSDVEVIQPTLWALEVALAAMWRHWGVEPDLLIGQSMGEIAAATVSGALTVRDGAAVVCRRGLLLSKLRGTGAMAFVQLGAEETHSALRQLERGVSVAVVSSDESCVLTGEPGALAHALEPLRDRGVYCRTVAGVDYASHGPQVDVLRDELLAALTELRPRESEVQLHSTVHDRLVRGAELDGAYWMENLRRPVLFASAIKSALAAERPSLFIEVSPHPVLVNAVQEAIDAAGTGAVIASLRRDRPELQTMLASLGGAYAAGVTPRWDRLHPQARYVPVPHYPWQRKAYWPELEHTTQEATPVASSVGGALSVTITGDNEIQIVRSPSAPAAPAGANGSTAVAGAAAATREVLTPDDNGSREALSSASALADYLLHRVMLTLELTADEIDVHTPLTGVGLDSLLGEQLRRQIMEDLRIDVPARQLLRGGTVAEIAQQFAT